MEHKSLAHTHSVSVVMGFWVKSLYISENIVYTSLHRAIDNDYRIIEFICSSLSDFVVIYSNLMEVLEVKCLSYNNKLRIYIFIIIPLYNYLVSERTCCIYKVYSISEIILVAPIYR